MAFSRPAAAAATASAHNDETEPLLSPGRHSSAARKRYVGTSRRVPAAEAPVDLGWLFICRLGHILLAVNAAPALSLLILSVAEAIIISKIGTISGMFYEVFVDARRDQVLHLMLWSAGCYTATAVFYAVKVSLQDFFAWRWRASLTCRLQQLYCSNLAFYRLKGIDNPDQRLAQDLPQLTSSLADTLSVLAAAPFNVVWYTRLTHQIFGSWYPVVAAYLFFLAGAVVQRLVMLPVASMVFKLEAAEGGFRYKHMRFRTSSEQIALYRSTPTEQHHLALQFSTVLACQGRLLLRRAILTTATKLLEYGGLIVNFGCLAAVVFSGAWDSERSTAGGIAGKVSVASFYLLTLIYSFTQVLDLASKVSNLAGLTARVSQLWEELLRHQQHSSHLQQHQQQQRGKEEMGEAAKFDNSPSGSSHTVLQPQTAETSHELDYQQQHQKHDQLHHPHSLPRALNLLYDHGSGFSHKRYASQAVTLLQPQLLTVLLPDSLHSTHGRECQLPYSTDVCSDEQRKSSAQSSSRPVEQPQILADDYEGLEHPHQQQQSQQQQQQQQLIQISVHSLGSDVLVNSVRRAFPDCPRLAPLTAVVTFQFCGQTQQVMLQQQQGLRSQQQQQHSLQQGQHIQHQMLAGNEAAGGYCDEGDMALMLEVFLNWQALMQSYLGQRGYWYDAIDPRTGCALHGTAGASYDEVIGAQVLLGYHKQQQGSDGYNLISHPVAGTQVYPATVFTSAPLPLIRDALAATATIWQDSFSNTSSLGNSSVILSSSASPVSKSYNPNVRDNSRQATAPRATAAAAGSVEPIASQPCVTSSSGPVQRLSHTPRQPASTGVAAAAEVHHAASVSTLLSCKDLTVSTPAGVLIVKDLSLDLMLGPPAAASHTPTAINSCSGTLIQGLPLGTSPVSNSVTVAHAPGAGLSSGVASLLIQGPSGCGKSTLLKCLAGLWPADSGTHLTASARAADAARGASPVETGRPVVMFIPQTMLAAPGSSFKDQLVYPAAAWPCYRHGSSSSSSSWPFRSGGSGLGDVASPGSGTYGECIVAIGRLDQQQEEEVADQLSWWDDWLTCGVLCHHHHQHHIYQQQQQLYCSDCQGIKHQQDLHSPILRPAQDNHVTKHQYQQNHRHQLLQAQPAVTSSNASGKDLCSPCQNLLLALQQVGLGYLLASLTAGLDTTADDWSKILSPGEQQRLAFARVLLHRPLLVILDEAASSLPDCVAVELYQVLQQSGISYVSVGHSDSLRGLHDRVLQIVGDGGGDWSLQ